MLIVINLRISGYKDFFNEENIYIQNYDEDHVYCMRAKVKSGVSDFKINPGIRKLFSLINYGLGDFEEPKDSQKCGEYIVFLIPIKSERRKIETASVHVGEETEFDNFISQIEILYDPFPSGIDYDFAPPYRIDSPDFSAPNGIFDDQNCIESSSDYSFFEGSTFKIGPRIFSEKCLKNAEIFPMRNDYVSDLEGKDLSHLTTIWAPFKDCPNLEKIEYQGEFGEALQELYPCDFTYQDKNGFDILDAYPTGGNPVSIFGYVRAKKLNFGAKFPQIGNKRLKYCDEIFRCESITIDATSTPIYPFGGITFKDCEMSFVSMPTFEWIVDLPNQPDDKMNFAFSWGSLGVEAPKSCKVVKNLYSIFSHVKNPSGDSGVVDENDDLILNADVDYNILTPNSARNNGLQSWGSVMDSLKDLDLTEDLMPKICSGIVKLEGYYRNYMSVDEPSWLDDFVKSGLYKWGVLTPKLDDEERFYEIQPLPEGIKILHGYAQGLYKYCVFEGQTITIPKIPNSVVYMRSCFKETFASVSGKHIDRLKKEIEPVIVLEYHESSKEQLETYPHFVFNVDKDFSNDFVKNFNKEFFKENNHPEIKRVRGMQFHSGVIDTSWPDSTSESFIDFSSLVKNVISVKKNAYLSTKYFNRGRIVFEESDLTKLQYNGDFMKDCWKHSQLDPTIISGLTSMIQTSEWENYAGALQIGGPILEEPLGNIIYRGFYLTDFGIDSTDFGTLDSGTKSVSFGFYLSYKKNFSTEEFYSRRPRLKDVIFEGSPRTTSDTVLTPYNDVFGYNGIYALDETEIDNFITEYNLGIDNKSLFDVSIKEEVIPKRFFEVFSGASTKNPNSGDPNLDYYNEFFTSYSSAYDAINRPLGNPEIYITRGFSGRKQTSYWNDVRKENYSSFSFRLDLEKFRGGAKNIIAHMNSGDVVNTIEEVYGWKN